MLGEEYGEEARIVFCRALYRRERENEGGQPDAVLTFEELKGWLEEEEN